MSSMYACSCKAVTDRTIDAVIASGASSVEEITSKCAAGGRCGFKAAGGIRTLADAATYLGLAESRLGSGRIDSMHFRIGASALFTELLAHLAIPE